MRPEEEGSGTPWNSWPVLDIYRLSPELLLLSLLNVPVIGQDHCFLRLPCSVVKHDLTQHIVHAHGVLCVSACRFHTHDGPRTEATVRREVVSWGTLPMTQLHVWVHASMAPRGQG